MCAVNYLFSAQISDPQSVMKSIALEYIPIRAKIQAMHFAQNKSFSSFTVKYFRMATSKMDFPTRYIIKVILKNILEHNIYCPPSHLIYMGIFLLFQERLTWFQRKKSRMDICGQLCKGIIQCNSITEISRENVHYLVYEIPQLQRVQKLIRYYQFL